MSKLKILVFGSGRGSNFQAIVDRMNQGSLDVEILAMVTNVPGSGMSQIARTHGIQIIEIPHQGLRREEHEKKIWEAIKGYSFDLVVLAGYMRIIGRYLYERIRSTGAHILNIHPSLLPKFRGLHAHKQVLDAKEEISGCTVHVVTLELDAGPILGQRQVVVKKDDTEDSLAARVLVEEHKLYSDVLQGIADGSITIPPYD